MATVVIWQIVRPSKPPLKLNGNAPLALGVALQNVAKVQPALSVFPGNKNPQHAPPRSKHHHSRSGHAVHTPLRPLDDRPKLQRPLVGGLHDRVDRPVVRVSRRELLGPRFKKRPVPRKMVGSNGNEFHQSSTDIAAAWSNSRAFASSRSQSASGPLGSDEEK